MTDSIEKIAAEIQDWVKRRYTYANNQRLEEWAERLRTLSAPAQEGPSLHEQIEDILDRAEVPCREDSGRWMTLPERLQTFIRLTQPAGDLEDAARFDLDEIADACMHAEVSDNDYQRIAIELDAARRAREVGNG